MAPKRPRADSQEDDESALEEVESDLARLPLPYAATTRKLRTDTAERQERNKTVDFSVVKMTLSQFCKDKGKALPWEEVLKDLNKMVAEAYVVANVHAIHACEKGFELPKLNNVFFYQCLSVVGAGAQGQRTTVTPAFLESVEAYKTWRGTEVAFANRQFINRGWQHNASMQMATNASNHVLVNFYRRFQKYLKLRYGLNGSECYTALQHIFAKEYDGEDDIVFRYRPRMPRTDKGLLDRSPHLLIPLTHTFLSYAEAYNREHVSDPDFRESRTFSLLPTKKGFECSHFKMCKLGLRALLQRAGMKPPAEGMKWNMAADKNWRKFFYIDKFETAGREFGGEIVTDGKAVSITFRKPKKPEPHFKLADVKERHFDVVWGLDPGRRDLFVATSSTGETIHCSAKEFYRDATYTKSNATIRHWQDHNAEVLEAIRNMPTKKTASLEKWKGYVQFMIPRFDMLLEFSIRKKFRDLKFRRYCMARKKFHQLCQKFIGDDGSRVAVGYGDWSTKDIGGFIKKTVCVPVKRLEHELRKFVAVIPIDECRTSKVHHGCSRTGAHDLRNMYQKRECKDGVKRTLKVHSVLHCNNNGGCGMTVNRDVNASKNILEIFQYQLQGQKGRPWAFARTQRAQGMIKDDKLIEY